MSLSDVSVGVVGLGYVDYRLAALAYFDFDGATHVVEVVRVEATYRGLIVCDGHVEGALNAYGRLSLNSGRSTVRRRLSQSRVEGTNGGGQTSFTWGEVCRRVRIPNGRTNDSGTIYWTNV